MQVNCRKVVNHCTKANAMCTRWHANSLYVVFRGKRWVYAN